MKKLLAAMFVALLMAGCVSEDDATPSDPADSPKAIDLDDKETLNRIIAEAIDGDKLGRRAEEPLLIPCKACKKEVSLKGEACANCSHPIADSVRAYKDGDEKLAYAPNQQTPYTGWAKKMYDNGQIDVLYQFKDGKPDGLFHTWHENGQKKSVGNFKDGKPDGLQSEYYENGQKEREWNFKDGELDGLETWWYSTGQKAAEVYFDNGMIKPNPKWFQKNGQIVLESENWDYKKEKISTGKMSGSDANGSNRADENATR